MLWLQYLRAATARQPVCHTAKFRRLAGTRSLAAAAVVVLVYFTFLLGLFTESQVRVCPVVVAAAQYGLHPRYNSQTILCCYSTDRPRTERAHTHSREARAHTTAHGPRFATWKHRINTKRVRSVNTAASCNLITKMTSRTKKDPRLLRTSETNIKYRNKIPD